MPFLQSSIFFVTVVLLSACATHPNSANEILSVRIDTIAENALKDGPVVGLSVAVARQGSIVHSRGYGVTSIEAHTPATGESIYNMASVAKIIAATAVLRLVDEGRLELDDTLSSLLPAFPNREQGEKITLRQLLNHTSGLNDYVAADIQRWKQTGEPLSPEFVLSFLDGRPLDFEPGTNWTYSNTGFYLAGLILERATAQAWGDYVLNSVTRPLDLESIALCDDLADTRSSGYDVTADGFLPSKVDTEQGVRGDAGLCGTVSDLARLPHALLTIGLLSDARLQEFQSPTMLTNGIPVDYGLGVARGTLDGHPLWGHLGGDVTSHIATLAHYREVDMTVVVVVNTRLGEVGALQVEAAVARAVLGLGAPALTDQLLTPVQQSRYSGTYVGDRANWRYRVVVDGQHIARVPVNDPSTKLILRYQGNHTFGRSDWPMDRFVFHVKKGQAQAYSTYYNGIFDGFYSSQPVSGQGDEKKTEFSMSN